MGLRKKYHPAWTRRKAVALKIKNNSIIYNSAKFFYKFYCNITNEVRANPSFYLIGMSSSGTSSFFMNFIKHPKIYPPVKKETRFFNQNFKRGFNWYKANFPLKVLMKKDQITGEGTPAYIDFSYVPERIKTFTPNAKFIVLLRNPIDRAFSIYNKRIQKGIETISFEEAIKLEYEIIKNNIHDDFYSDDTVFLDLIKEENPRISLRRNLYYPKFKKWFKIFKYPEQFLFLDNEELKKNPEATYNRAFDFLGLDKFDIKNLATFNVNTKKQKMKDSTRKWLEEFFKLHNERFYELLGKRFEWN